MSWTDLELGEALEARDYKKMKTLLRAGADFNSCILNADKMGWPPLHNALSYAYGQNDLKLLKFVVNNRGIIRNAANSGSRYQFFYPYRNPDMFEFLCKTAYKRMIKNTTQVNVEMIEGLLVYFNLNPAGFLKKELIHAAKTKNTKAAARILKVIIKKNRIVLKEELYENSLYLGCSR